MQLNSVKRAFAFCYNKKKKRTVINGIDLESIFHLFESHTVISF